MSKKKEINLKSTPAEVESGDVNIRYNDVLVGSLSESGSAVLKTEMTICEHDIELEYTKSGSDAPAGNIVNITNNSSGTPVIEGRFITPEGVAVDIATGYLFNIPTGISKLYLYNIFQSTGEGLYINEFLISSSVDAYSVVVNGTPLVKDREGYSFRVQSTDGPITGQTYNVVITDKV